jgi:hypothetical protein
MTNRRQIGANTPRSNAAVEDDLTRLVRTIARQAAQEVVKALRDAQEARASPGGPPPDPLIPQGTRIEGAMSEAGQGIGSDERFFSVAEIADQLGLSQKVGPAKDRQGRADRDPNREAAADRRAQQGRLHRSSASKQRHDKMIFSRVESE